MMTKSSRKPDTTSSYMERDEQGRFVPCSTHAPTVAVPDNVEGDEIAQFCSRCGQGKGEFDLFCRTCSSPLVRRFRAVLPLEVALFLAAGVLASLAEQQYISRGFLDAPLGFIGQLMILYLVRLSLRQPRFSVLVSICIALLVAHFIGMSMADAFASAAPLYLAIGVLVLWVSRLRGRTYWDSLQALWIGFVIVGLCLTTFARNDGVLQNQLQHESLDRHLMQLLGHTRMDYTPWLALAGLSATLAIKSGLRAARSYTSVKDDYYAEARIISKSPSISMGTPRLFVQLIIGWRLLVRVIASFYNALISALNFVTRCVMFVKGIVQAFVVAIIRELAGTIRETVSFVYWSALRVAVPVFAISTALFVAEKSGEQLRAHLFNPTINTSKDVLWMGTQIVIAMFAAVLGFARVSVRELIETYFRDLAALLGYAIPLLLLCSLTLTLGTMGVNHKWGVDLRFHLSYLSFACLFAVAVSALLVSLSRIRARRNCAHRDAE